MNITEVKTFVMRGIARNWVIVKIETDEAIHGWGEALTLLKHYLEHGVTYGEVPAQ